MASAASDTASRSLAAALKAARGPGGASNRGRGGFGGLFRIVSWDFGEAVVDLPASRAAALTRIKPRPTAAARSANASTALARSTDATPIFNSSAARSCEINLPQLREGPCADQMVHMQRPADRATVAVSRLRGGPQEAVGGFCGGAGGPSVGTCEGVARLTFAGDGGTLPLWVVWRSRIPGFLLRESDGQGIASGRLRRKRRSILVISPHRASSHI